MFSFIHIHQKPQILNTPQIIYMNRRERREKKSIIKYSLKNNSVLSWEFLAQLEQAKNGKENIF
jgi:hypothetical protein